MIARISIKQMARIQVDLKNYCPHVAIRQLAYWEALKKLSWQSANSLIKDIRRESWDKVKKRLEAINAKKKEA